MPNYGATGRPDLGLIRVEIALSRPLLRQVDDLAHKLDLPRSTVIRNLLNHHLNIGIWDETDLELIARGAPLE